MTPATNTVVEAVDKIRDTASSHNRLFFVEVMGRDSGYIALKTAIATGAIAVMTPEAGMTIDDLIEILQRGEESNKTSFHRYCWLKETPMVVPWKLQPRFTPVSTSMTHV